VNLGLRNDVPILSTPWLLWVWVYFRSPRPDGLSDSKEAPEKFKIEDALTQQLSQNCGAVLSGRITTEGRREFYFYGETRTVLRPVAIIKKRYGRPINTASEKLTKVTIFSLVAV
jgi:hypothetical protein